VRNLRVFAALVLSGMTASCAERVVTPAGIASPSPAPEAEPNLRLNIVGENRRTVVIMEGAKKRSAARTRQVDDSARTERRLEVRAPKSQTSQAPREPWHNPPSVAALPLPPKPAEPSVPAVAVLPPPPEPAEPNFPLPPFPHESAVGIASVPPLAPDASVEAAKLPPRVPSAPTLSSVPPSTEAAPTPELAAPSVPEASPEAAMPPLPEPAEPTFPMAARMPPPPEPAEPLLPEPDAIAAETPVSIPLPELSENLSLRPRSDWREVTETFSIPRSLLSGVVETNPERSFPSLILDPWPLAVKP
jgi:hypothetical protein